jgi:DNA topoisomerase-1
MSNNINSNSNNNTKNTNNTNNTDNTDVPPFNYNKRKFYTLKIHPVKSKAPLVSRRIYLDNNLVNDKKTKTRIQSLGIPPAYIKNGAVVSKSAENDIQAMGINDKQQVQYIYHPNFIKRQTKKKYKDVLNLGEIIPRIENQVRGEIVSLANKQHLAKEDLFPIILFMLTKYHFRIGNMKYSTDNHSYGITTLKPEHIHLKTSPKFEIKFIGKKGVVNHIEDSNASMWKLLSKLKNGSNQFIFKLGGNEIITPLAVKDYLVDKYDTYITPKMFRTWYANYHLLDYLQEHRNDVITASNKREQKGCVNNAVEYVSRKLNNTPGISRKAYVSNKIFNVILNNPRAFIKQIPDRNIHQYLAKIMKKNVV